ncbi:hypothetical protein GQ457_15G010730 [Hibiscus cannabinus]
MTWVHLLRLKSDTLETLKQFLVYVKTQFSACVKIIRSDNGTGFFLTEGQTFFTSNGIVHQSSCVHTPQQNDVAERKHRHLLEVARALKFQSHVPTKFWGECVLTACYLINRLPSLVLEWKSPYEMLYNKCQSLSHLMVFGCLCYATVTNYHDKFQPKDVPCVFMGYSLVQRDTFCLPLSPNDSWSIVMSHFMKPYSYSSVKLNIFLYFLLNYSQ